MPCEPYDEVIILLESELSGYFHYEKGRAHVYGWRYDREYKRSRIIGWRYASPDQPKAEPTEFERLREENRLMRDAIKEAFDLLLDGENTRAGSTLQPFIKP